MKTRNTNTFRAQFTGLRGHAFGVPTVFDWTPEIEIYQARVSPELWRARPQMKRLGHTWEAGSAEGLMEVVTNDFVALTKPWSEWTRTGACVGLVNRVAMVQRRGRLA